MKHRGFTIVELLIVIAVMGILLGMSFSSYDGSQKQVRDQERAVDISTLAVHLENFYTSGSDTITSIGQYPSVQISGGLIGAETSYLRDIDTDTIITPTQQTSSLVAATNNTQTISGVLPQPTVFQYVYQPIATDGSLCDNMSTKECRKFNLYYRTEVDDVIHLVTSKNQ